MKKFFCDRCGSECKNKALRVHGSVLHFTSDRNKTYAGEDSLEPLELCGHCQDAYAEFMGPAYRIQDCSSLREAAQVTVTEGAITSANMVYGPYTEDGRAPEVASDPHP